MVNYEREKASESSGGVPKKRVISVLLSLALVVGTLSALGVDSCRSGFGGSRVAKATGGDVTYIDGDGATQTCTGGSYEVITDQITWGSLGNTTWYVVDDDKTIGSRITVAGTVNLILCDEKTLTANSGITVADDDTNLTNGSPNVLKIYGQGAGTGTLEAKVEGQTVNDAAIGGKENVSNGNCGEINIYGGKVNATVTALGNTHSSAEANSAGIGGGKGGSGGNITIYGGTVNATVKASDNNNTNVKSFGAGIGGGNNGTGGNITINGGTITATATSSVNSFGAGIGGGKDGSGGTIMINGGTITAKADANSNRPISVMSSGAGIGGGSHGSGGTITITDGDVTATATAKTTAALSAESYGAGIGGGAGGSGGTIVIDDGTVEATATAENTGNREAKSCGAGIGGGSDKSFGSITIRDGNVTAKSTVVSNASKHGDGCGVGNGSGASGAFGDITISGGTVTAKGGDSVDYNSDQRHGICGGNIDISGSANVTANGGGGSGTNNVTGGHGICGIVRITGGSPTVKAIGGDGTGNQLGGCGIKGNVTVSGGVSENAVIYATAGVDKDNNPNKAIIGYVNPGTLKIQKGESSDGPWSLIGDGGFDASRNEIDEKYVRISGFGQPSNPGGNSGGGGSNSGSSTSQSYSPTSSQPQPRLGDGLSGWSEIGTAIANIPDGGSLDIDMNGTITLPAIAISSIQGRDINLVLNMGGGIKWTINGNDLSGVSGDVYLGVYLGTSGIPVEIINKLTGEREKINLMLSRDGGPGFRAILTIPLKPAWAGQVANLFNYNKVTENMDFVSSGTINPDGSADLVIGDNQPSADEASSASAAPSVKSAPYAQKAPSAEATSSAESIPYANAVPYTQAAPSVVAEPSAMESAHEQLKIAAADGSGQASSFYTIVIDDHSLDPNAKPEPTATPAVTPEPTVEPIPEPTQAQELTLSAASKQGKITLSWNEQTEASKYRIYQLIDGRKLLLKTIENMNSQNNSLTIAKAFSAVKKKKKTTYHRKKLKVGKEYTFIIRACINSSWTRITDASTATVKV